MLRYKTLKKRISAIEGKNGLWRTQHQRTPACNTYGFLSPSNIATIAVLAHKKDDIMQTFIAFPASPRLHKNTTEFVERMAGGATRPEPDTLKAIMADFNSESLTTFFELPAKQLGLKGAMLKAVQTTVSTIRGATNLVINRTAPKLNLAQNKEMAHYMDVMRICLQNAAGEDEWQVAFPLKANLHQRAESAFALLEENKTEAAREQLLQFLYALTDEALFWYMEQPLKLLHLGPILSRVCKASNETARKASKAIIRKVVGKLDADGLNTIRDFIKALIAQSEPRFPEQSTN